MPACFHDEIIAMAQKSTAGGWIVIFGAAAAAAILGAVVGIGAFMLFFMGGPPPEGAGGPPGDMGGIPPALVSLGVATNADLRDRFEVVGRLREIKRSTIAAEVEGKVLTLPVEEGDAVVGGQTVLAEIEGVWSRLALQAAEADVAARRAMVDQAQRDAQQLEELLSRGSAKPREVDDAKATLASEQAALEAAIAAQNRATEVVDRLKIIAPFDGAVVGKMTEVGQWVERGSAVMEVISAGRIDAVLDVPETLVNTITPGMKIVIEIDAIGVEVEGEVASITPSGANAARTFPVKVRIDDPTGRLRSGMSVTGRLPIGDAADRLTVPRDAVQFTTQGPVVWVAMPTADGQLPQALPAPVKAGFSIDGRMVVEPIGGPESPLHPDARVVTEGAERLFPTQPLMTIQNQVMNEEVGMME